MSKRLGIEKKIENGDFKIKIGTLNKYNPLNLIIESGTFISPFEEKDDYTEDTDFLEKSINDNIKNFIKQNKIFNKNYICVFDLPHERMKVGKNSYLSLQCHLKQNGGLTLDEFLNTTANLSKNLFKEIEKTVKCCGFILNKTRKKTIYKENILQK
jgi:hypothetical protein